MKMKWSGFTGVIMLMLGLSSLSCGSTQPVQEKNSLLWQISGNGLEHKSYLFGTIHLIPEDDFFFPKHFEKALRSSKKLVMEIDLSDMMGQLKVIQKMMLPDGMTLKDLYSEEDYARLKKLMKDSAGTSIEIYQTMKPIFTSQTIAGMDIRSGMKSYELHMMELALKNNIAMAGLETAEEQLMILDSIPLSKQAEMLLQALETMHESNQTVKKIIEQYKEQNLDSLYKLFDAESELSEHQVSLLDNRNKKWIPKIEDYLKEGPVFIAVGAGHLGGPNGVIKLLQDKGYVLTPI